MAHTHWDAWPHPLGLRQLRLMVCAGARWAWGEGRYCTAESVCNSHSFPSIISFQSSGEKMEHAPKLNFEKLGDLVSLCFWIHFHVSKCLVPSLTLPCCIYVISNADHWAMYVRWKKKSKREVRSHTSWGGKCEESVCRYLSTFLSACLTGTGKKQ